MSFLDVSWVAQSFRQFWTYWNYSTKFYVTVDGTDFLIVVNIKFLKTEDVIVWALAILSNYV